jgi:hypothetical protein
MAELYEFQPPGRFARVRYTPLREALRGEWTARLDPRAEIAAAALPAPLPDVVYTVVRRCRLWRREQLDVARELIAHFSDGLAAGRSPEALARDFGSPQQAARLIRRAKLRVRPLAWKSWRVFLSFIAGSLVVYALWSARFYWGQPLLARNYWSEINAARRVPQPERAWPIYRDALFKLGRKDAHWMDTDKIARGPEGKDWTKAVAALERHQDSLRMVREGAKKTVLGYYLGDPDDQVAAKAAHGEWLIGDQIVDQNSELLSTSLDGPQSCRSIARWLQTDARVAAFKGDGETVLADLTAAIGVAEQQFAPHGMLVEQLVGMAIFNVIMENVSRILFTSPAVLSDAQLRDLAHRIAAFRGGSMTVDFSGEKMLFDDCLQRAYTDDGQGNGRMTWAGLQYLDHLSSSPANGLLSVCRADTKDPGAQLGARLVSPGVAAVIGSREENSQFYRSLMEEMIALHQGDPWKWDRSAIDAHQQRFEDGIQGPANGLKHAFVGLLLPAISAVYVAAERTAQTRDAAEVAIALEVWHRRHGTWPERLEQLVPDLLPAVPADRLDGQPLHYVVRDGQPVLYSVGRDRRDDGGRATPSPNDAIPTDYAPQTAEMAKREVALEASGDWILWPPLSEELPEEEDDLAPTTELLPE